MGAVVAGLGASEDKHYWIAAAAADGGIWLLRTSFPQPVSDLATRKLIEAATKVVGGM